METMSGAQEIVAMVPLAEMFGYATALRSRSQGRATYVMEPDHFAEVPKSVQEQIVTARGRNNE
jgi:elongation factor G